MSAARMPSSHTRSGVGTLVATVEFPEKVIASAQQYAYVRGTKVIRVRGMHAWEARKLAKGRPSAIILRDHNAYVNTGLNNALDREFGLGGTAVGYIGVSSNTTAVTSATVNLNGASGGAAANTIIKAISPAATRSSQTVTGGATFVNADFTSGVFVWNKIGFLTTSTDAGTGLVDVIGGTGGSSPYNRTFSLDLTGAGTFSVTAQIAVTATAT